MTENRHGIQTKLTKRTDFQTDRVLLLGQVAQKKENATPSHLLKYLLARRTSPRIVKPKEPFFANALTNNNNFKNVIFELIMTNQSPEQIARGYNDIQLIASGWLIQPGEKN